MEQEWTTSESTWTTPDGKVVPFISKTLWIHPGDLCLVDEDCEADWSSYLIELSIFSQNTRVSVTEVSGPDEESFCEHRRTVGKYPNNSPAIAQCVAEIIRRIESTVPLMFW